MSNRFADGKNTQEADDLKIGTCILFDSIEKMETKFKTLINNGFNSCQLLSWIPALWTQENADRLSQLIEEYGVTVSAF